MDANEISILFVTAGSSEEAESLARTLLEERLIACANLVPGVRSIYRWQGAIEESEEFLLILKTRSSLAEAVIRRIRESHSYEVCEALQVPVVAGNPPYLAWVLEETETP